MQHVYTPLPAVRLCACRLVCSSTAPATAAKQTVKAGAREGDCLQLQLTCSY